jgi:Lipocalin-like domain
MSWPAEVLMSRAALLFCVLVSIGRLASAQEISRNRSVSDRLIGAWLLVSVETKRANGEIIYPFYGKHPQGLLIYDRSGWMSVQIVSDPAPSVPTASSREAFLRAPSAEKEKAIDGFYGYYGTWSVDAAGLSVTHHIRQSLYPGERGEEGVRRFVLNGNRLTLTAEAHEMGETHERVLVWERIERAEEKPRRTQ